ncbi:MAG: CHAT domain-containing protein [Pyrinomonadaceae bacterium]
MALVLFLLILSEPFAATHPHRSPLIAPVYAAAHGPAGGDDTTPLPKPKDEQRIAAGKAFASAEELRAEDKAASLRQAIAKYEEALAAWKSAGDRLKEADALKNIGEVYQRLGESQTALKYGEQALRLSRKVNDRRAEGEILNNIGYVYLSLGDSRKAQDYCARALKISRAFGNRRGEAQALNNMGEIHYGFGAMQQSLAFYEQSLTLWRGLSDRRGQALVMLNFGYTYSDLSETQKALDSYQEALTLWRAVDERRGQAVALTAIGRLNSRLGESQKALDLFNQAMSLIQPLGDAIEEARVFTGLGYVYEKLNERQKALESYERALGLFRAATYRNGEATTLHDMGSVYYALGEHQKALDYFQQVRTMARELSDERMQSYALRAIGMAHDALGAKEKALGFYAQALSINRAGGDRRGETDTLNLIGRLYDERGEHQKALSYYQRALPLSRATEYRFGESSTLYNMAHAERDRGHLDEARTLMEAALRIVESLRAKVAGEDLRTSYFASVQQHYELYIDLLMQSHKRHPADGFDAAALEASERARARSMLETLREARADIHQVVDANLIERERSLHQALNDKAERQMRLLSGKHSDEEATAAAKEIDEITTAYEDVRAQIRAASPHYAALTQPQPFSLKEIQEQVLDGDTILLEYALGEEKSYVWRVTRDSIDGYELPKRAEIEEAARRVYELLKAYQPVPGETLAQRQARGAEADAQYWQQAAALSRMILGPVTGQLGNRRLLIIADGALQYVPFGALPVSDAFEPLPLIIDHEIVNLPSASTLAVLRQETARRTPAPGAVAVIADPVFEKDDPRIEAQFRKRAPVSLEQGAKAAEQTETTVVRSAVRDAGVPGTGGSIPRLLASREEAAAIMESAPAGARMEAIGFDASRATAMSAELSRYRIVHFATHGLLNNEHPELSGVILSLVDQRGESVDGFLRLHDIYNLRLPADLVVLSACNTGLGKDVKGEGLIGLTRGFMYAGASGVMASLWKVDDEATAELMKYFYRGMLKEGLPPSAALRQAQMMMLKQKRWRSPYYWAAFALQGEYKGRIQVNEQTGARSGGFVAAGAMVLVFSIGGGLYAARRRRRRAMYTGAV